MWATGLMRSLSVITLLIAILNNSFGQLTTNTGVTPAVLVNNYLLGQNVSVGNITYTGAPQAIGTFNGANSNLGINSGIIITTGDVAMAAGANNTSSAGIDNQLPGDSELTAIASLQTFDASVLEFDFVPEFSKIKFRYIFGSEEYNEFVCTGVNDLFGFFISGPGIVGSQNLAVVPGTSIPVSINTINNGVPMGNDPNCNLGNTGYFVDNTLVISTTVQYDGFTTILTAEANVIPCETYHIRLAIADGGDGIYDSGVFLEAGSFSGENFLNIANVGNAIDSASIEGCAASKFLFSIPDPLPTDYVVKYSINGTAVNGTDYVKINDSIVIPAGQKTAQLNITPIPDALLEGTETVILTLSLNSACSTDSIFATVKIRDLDSLQILLPTDTFTCLNTPITLLATTTGGHGAMQYLWNDGSIGNATIALGTSAQTYTVTVKDGCQQIRQDSILVKILEKASFAIETGPTTCNNVPVTINLIGAPSANAFYTWNFDGGSVNSGTNQGPYEVTYPRGGVYTILAIIIDGPCIIIDSAEVAIEDCEVTAPNIITPNNDGFNDALVFGGLEAFPGSLLQVYNRWGNLVFEDANYSNNWMGDALPEGTYFYVLNVNGGKPVSSSLAIIRN